MGIGCALKAFRDMEKASPETIVGMATRFDKIGAGAALTNKPVTTREKAFLFFFAMNMK